MALTDTKLRAIKANGERREYPDRGGLVLRVSARGATTWTVSYRVRGQGEVGGERVARLASPKRRLALGDYPTVGLAEARARAAEAKRLARAGVDPADEPRGGAGRARGPDGGRPRCPLRGGAPAAQRAAVRRRRREEAAPARAARLGQAAGGRDRARRPRAADRSGARAAHTRGPRGRQDPAPGARRAGRAAEVRKWCRAMFQFAVDAGLRPDNPFADVRNRDRQRPRDRVLSMEELGAVWEAAGDLGYPWGPGTG
jgi:hypothetical protein